MEYRYQAVCFDLFGTLVDEGGRAVEGAQAVLNGIAVAKWTIVTSAPRVLALSILNHAELPVPSILVTADDVIRSKPDPACYLRAARMLDIQPERILAIEDSQAGLQSARAAGMDTVVVLMGRPPQSVGESVFYADRLADIELRRAPGGCVILTWSR